MTPTLFTIFGLIAFSFILFGLWLRTDLASRSASQALNHQERLERSLNQNRHELGEALARNAAAVELKLTSLETQVDTRLQENRKDGFAHFERVQAHLSQAELQLASLKTMGQSITDLNQLLKLPHLRGGFGEATLERLLSDSLPLGSFEMQAQVTPGSSERVDALIQFARLKLPIDSKFPREQVLPLFESGDPTLLAQARVTLSEILRTQARSIASKYIRPEHGTTDMALMFLPSETLYFEVVRDGALFEALAKLKVYPVSPNTLAIALHSVAMAQEYYDMAQGVEKTIEDVKKARRHFEHFERKFEELGKSLKKAQESFETANTHLGHYETSVYRLTGEGGSEPPAPPIIEQ